MVSAEEEPPQNDGLSAMLAKVLMRSTTPSPGVIAGPYASQSGTPEVTGGVSVHAKPLPAISVKGPSDDQELEVPTDEQCMPSPLLMATAATATNPRRSRVLSGGNTAATQDKHHRRQVGALFL